MAKNKTVFYCTECGNETLKWQGQCPACGAWNTIVEQPAAPKRSVGTTSHTAGPVRMPVKISEISSENGEQRFSTGLSELDRVLGGGAVRDSLVLVGGAPGIGKSTLLLQICSHLSKELKILYVSGEESEKQLKMRAERLNVSGDDIYIFAETNLASIADAVRELHPDVMIIDSIQTLYNGDLTTSPGSVSQVKDCTLTLMQLAKGEGVTTFVIGHINKDGAIAGPKVLEHMVDCVLYFEGESGMNYRILRAAKNRFGSTNEIGVFEMYDNGLREVENPSEMLLSGHPLNSPGTCITCAMEGTRPILAEIQALVAKTTMNVPRRTSSGIDYNRTMLLLAVLEKRGNLRVNMCDAYINVTGGLSLDETAVDLAVALAIASSFIDTPVGDDICAVGEIGLAGELRSVTNINQRLAEIRRLGFTRCVLPQSAVKNAVVPDGLQLIKVKNVREAIAAVFG